jgi:hypothetical protein
MACGVRTNCRFYVTSTHEYSIVIINIEMDGIDSVQIVWNFCLDQLGEVINISIKFAADFRGVACFLIPKIELNPNDSKIARGRFSIISGGHGQSVFFPGIVLCIGRFLSFCLHCSLAMSHNGGRRSSHDAVVHCECGKVEAVNK